MTPYYDDGQITIYCGDCRAILPTLDAGSVDLVFADPPYSEVSLAWDALVDGWLPHAERVLNASGSLWCFGSFKYFMRTLDKYAQDWKHAQEIVWEKHNGSGFLNDRFRRVHELLVQFYPARNRWSDIYKNPQYTSDETKPTRRSKRRPTHFGSIDAAPYESKDGGPKLMRSVQYVRSCHGYAVHPTQKPEGIVRPAIAYSLPPGGLLVDPFAGSGTSLVVAREMGARAIGIELHEEDCAIAVRRLECYA